MLIIALVLAAIGLVALVAAVVTSNELIAWVCIGASVIGVLLLIADALRSRRHGADADTDAESDTDAADAVEEQDVQDYPDEPATEEPETAEVAGVTDAGDDTAGEGDTGGAVEISPDPEGPPKN